jgi:hypothetical protein
MCAFLLESIATTFLGRDSLDTAWATRTAFLRFASEESHTDSNQGAKVYLCLSGEPTEILLRVYDRCNLEQGVREEQSTHDVAAPRPIPQFIDWNRFQQLAYTCVETHPECFLVGDRTFPPGFRLIDVKQRKVIHYRNDEVPP